MTHPARLVLNKGVRHRILAGHPWVFAGEVDRVHDRVRVNLETVGFRANEDRVNIVDAKTFRSFFAALRKNFRHRLRDDRPMPGSAMARFCSSFGGLTTP